MTEKVLEDFTVARFNFYVMMYNGVRISTYNKGNRWIIYMNGKLVKGYTFPSRDEAIKYLRLLVDNE